MSKSSTAQAEKQLLAEIKAFEKLQPQLKRDNPNGGYAVIKDGKVLGVWHDRTDALNEGIKAWGNVVFLVQDINYTDKPVFFSRNIFATQ